MTVTAADVAAWMKIPGAVGRDDALIDQIDACLSAVVKYVTDHYDDKPNDNSSDPADWSTDIDRAIILETARLYQRRATPGGNDTFADLGVIRVSRFMDPDAERLLAPYLLPAIG